MQITPRYHSSATTLSSCGDTHFSLEPDVPWLHWDGAAWRGVVPPLSDLKNDGAECNDHAFDNVYRSGRIGPYSIVNLLRLVVKAVRTETVGSIRLEKTLRTRLTITMTPFCSRYSTSSLYNAVTEALANAKAMGAPRTASITATCGRSATPPPYGASEQELCVAPMPKSIVRRDITFTSEASSEAPRTLERRGAILPASAELLALAESLHADPLTTSREHDGDAHIIEPSLGSWIEEGVLPPSTPPRRDYSSRLSYVPDSDYYRVVPELREDAHANGSKSSRQSRATSPQTHELIDVGNADVRVHVHDKQASPSEILSLLRGHPFDDINSGRLSNEERRMIDECTLFGNFPSRNMRVFSLIPCCYVK